MQLCQKTNEALIRGRLATKNIDCKQLPWQRIEFVVRTLFSNSPNANFASFITKVFIYHSSLITILIEIIVKINFF